METLSLWEVDRLPEAKALTWLDTAIANNKVPTMAERNFGAELSAAFRARTDWLIAQDHAYRDPAGRLTLKANMLNKLNAQGWAATGRRLEAELDQVYRPMIEGTRITGRHTRDVALPTGRLAVIQDRTTFTRIPKHTDRAIMLAICLGRHRGSSR